MSVVQRQLLTPVDYFIPSERRFYTSGPRKGEPRDKLQSTVSAPFNGGSVLAPLATVTLGISIDSSFDFLAFALNATATLTDNVTFLPQIPVTVLLTPSSSGARLMDQAQHIENLRGTGSWPGSTVWPIWLPGSSTLNVQLVSLDPVNTMNIWVSLPGIAIY